MSRGLDYIAVCLEGVGLGLVGGMIATGVQMGVLGVLIVALCASGITSFAYTWSMADVNR